jgi:hypothetical protein
MATYLDGMDGGKHNSDNAIASFKPKRKKYQVLSPDGFTIEFDTVHYTSRKKAIEAFNQWKKRYELQGYYSSTKYGRIPLEDLEDYCQFIER